MSALNGTTGGHTPVGVGLISSRQTTELAKALACELDRLSLIARRPQGEDLIVAGPLTVDTAGHEVLVHDSAVALKPREFALLSALVQNVGRVLSRDQLLGLAWPEPERVNDNRTVDVHVVRLRRKLGKAANLILTVRGVGYKLARVAPSRRPQT